MAGSRQARWQMYFMQSRAYSKSVNEHWGNGGCIRTEADLGRSYIYLNCQLIRQARCTPTHTGHRPLPEVVDNDRQVFAAPF